MIYEYRLEGADFTVLRISGMRSKRKQVQFLHLDMKKLIIAAAEGDLVLSDAERLSKERTPRRIFYNVSAHDARQGSALLYAEGIEDEQGRIIKACFQPYPQLVEALKQLAPERVMFSDELL